MSNNIIPFEQSAGLPAHIAEMFGTSNNTDLTSNVGMGGFPVVSYKGKVWHIVDGDTRTLVTKPGEDDPAAALEVVILKANPNLSKVWYAKGYEEGSNAKPDCYSNDGKTPAADAEAPQCGTCALCPHNQWGSKVTENGAKGKACSDSRKLAIAPAGDLEYPMLLRIPAGTLKELSAYADMLNRRKAPYQAVVTKIGFDHTVAHQKLTFKAIRWLTAEEVQTVSGTLERPIIDQIIGATPMQGHDDGLGEAPAHVKQIATPAKPAAQAQPAPAQAAPAPAAAAPATKPKRTPKFTATVEEVEQAMAPATAPAQEPVAQPATQPAKAKHDHSALLAGADATLDDVLSALDD